MAGEVTIALEVPEQGIVGEVTVRAPYYLPLGEVTVVGRSPHRVTVRLKPRAGAASFDPEDGEVRADVPLGSLPILGTAGRGRLRTHYLPLPPPPPFADGDVEVMWGDVVSLPPPVPASVRRDATVLGAGRLGGLGRRIEALPRLLEAASLVLRRWPMRESSETIWRPTGVVGGREDPRTTESRAAYAGGGRVEGVGPIPDRSARVRGSLSPWRLGAVASLVTECRQQVVDLGDAEIAAIVDPPLRRLAERSRLPRGSAPDPPPSSWPQSMRMLYEAALEFVAGASAVAEGRTHVPLCHAWRLYEGWVGARSLAILRELLGEPSIPAETVRLNSRGDPVWRATWHVSGGTTVSLWSQAEIGAGAENLGVSVTSCTSKLIPDAALTVVDGEREFVVLFDAKYRGGVRMTSGDLCAAAAKYLWGVRRSADLTSHAVTEAVVVSTAGATAPLRPSTAAIRAVRATPTHGAELRIVIEDAVSRALPHASSTARSPGPSY